MVINLVVPAALNLTLSVPGLLELLSAKADKMIGEIGDRMNALEQELTDSITAQKAAVAALETRVTASEAASQAAFDQLTATNATLQTTVTTLQAEVNAGNIGGAAGPIVAQAIADLTAETTDINNFQASVPPPVVPVTIPVPDPGAGAGATGADPGAPVVTGAPATPATAGTVTG